MKEGISDNQMRSNLYIFIEMSRIPYRVMPIIGNIKGCNGGANWVIKKGVIGFTSFANFEKNSYFRIIMGAGAEISSRKG